METDDLSQDVFDRLCRNQFRLIRDFDPNRASLSTWLALVARSVTLDHLRRRRPATVSLEETGVEAQYSGEMGPTPDVRIPKHLLTPRQRLVLSLIFDRECTPSEAAAILGVEPQTIRSTQHKAIERLRQYFLESGSSEGSHDTTPLPRRASRATSTPP